MDKEPKIVSRVFSEKGRENYDRIFRKKEDKILICQDTPIRGIYYFDRFVPTHENGNIEIEKEVN